MSEQQPITLDLLREGPDAQTLGLVDLVTDVAKEFNYDLANLNLLTANIVQDPLPFSVNINPPFHFVTNTNEKSCLVNKTITKTFGMFIGRSNVHRLYLSSYLWNQCNHQTIQTFHYDSQIDFHQANVGLSELSNQYGTEILEQVSMFLQHTPILGKDNVEYPILMNQHCNLNSLYQDFFVEIACETYYTGQTFFPTEKTWRAIATGTPFIIQGPQHYLNRLRNLGFKTFSSYWDEGYAEDPADHQPYEIVKVINHLSTLSIQELQKMYQDMQPTLQHNHERLKELTKEELSHVQ